MITGGRPKKSAHRSYCHLAIGIKVCATSPWPTQTDLVCVSQVPHVDRRNSAFEFQLSKLERRFTHPIDAARSPLSVFPERISGLIKIVSMSVNGYGVWLISMSNVEEAPTVNVLPFCSI